VKPSSPAAQAGLGYRGNELDHHTILVNLRTGEQALWQRVYDWQRHVPCRQQPCVPFRKLMPGFAPGPDVIEVPAHPPAWPLLLAAMIAPRLSICVRRMSWLRRNSSTTSGGSSA